MTFNNDEPNDDGTNRNRIDSLDPKQFHAARDARELPHHVAEVDEQNPEHHEERDAESEFFANQVAESFAGHCAHARRDFLNYDQGKRDRNHGPQQAVPKLRAGS